jgi:hypothetical protein
VCFHQAPAIIQHTVIMQIDPEEDVRCNLSCRVVAVETDGGFGLFVCPVYERPSVKPEHVNNAYLLCTDTGHLAGELWSRTVYPSFIAQAVSMRPSIEFNPTAGHMGFVVNKVKLR